MHIAEWEKPGPHTKCEADLGQPGKSAPWRRWRAPWQPGLGGQGGGTGGAQRGSRAVNLFCLFL